MSSPMARAAVLSGSAAAATVPRGQLIIDGEPLPAAHLLRMVDSATSALEDLGVGEEAAVSTPARSGLPVVVAALAARRLGAALVFGVTPPADGAQPRRMPAARVCDGPSGGDPVVEPARPGPGDSLALPGECAVVFPTSGSTGWPKSVLLSRGALEYQAAASGERFEVTPADHWVVPIPLSHAYGFSILQMWLRFGCTLHVLSALRPGGVAKAVGDPRSSMLDGVPALYAVLLRLAEREHDLRGRLAGLRLRGCGGDVLPEPLHRRFAEVTGQPIHDGYGLTEAGPNVAVSTPSVFRPGTVGRALSGTQVKIANETGELLVRGPGLMSGYLDDPGATARAFTAGGWLRTGDRADLSADGFLRIIGRLKDVIIVQGETFAPAAIEQVLLEHPGVAGAAVVGQPGGRQGDRVVAYIVARSPAPGASLVAELARSCRAVLPPAMRPRTIELIARLPLLATGKLDRGALRRRGGHGDG
jgi:acyl-CoA synthetase (AMP-forming)/AMP-acid ligase II